MRITANQESLLQQLWPIIRKILHHWPESLPETIERWLTVDPKTLHKDERTRVLEVARLAGHSSEIKLPLHREQHFNVLAAAFAWLQFQNYLATNRIDSNVAEIDDTEQFKNYDKHLIHRLAARRTERELCLLGPIEPDCESPGIKEVNHIRLRFTEYVKARTRAHDLLAQCVYAGGTEKSPSKVSPWHQALGVPRPPEGVKKYRQIAKLREASRVGCSQRRALGILYGRRISKALLWRKVQL